VLDLQTSVVDKLPDDVTFVTKQVGNGTWYNMCFVTSFIVF
jgi:hypothetical protein